MNDMHLKFYSRPACALCEEGIIALKLVQEDVAFTYEVINIEENNDIHEKYMLMIPVVELDGAIILYGNLDYPTLLETLQDK